ncbi:PP2C family serine/threonine-protein phosphatase [Ferrimonas balearica]|uniref:PP2C family serine/threonine-protein phosphatase n=1 Tax=Ferrimonas balearica TaxID=44012 RepID=UPI001F30FB1E|nr:PP2C family serine/threonine-protein phosphatase [Ferrimonas balearica]MBY6093953.1 protein phosphatase 2C domain-containing protein [Ferrimonas balearica]
MVAVQIFGASVKGPAHILDNLPNQDALLLRRLGKLGTLAVVCDGMGSRPHADIGARKACNAVQAAIKKLGDSGFCPKALIPEIHRQWVRQVQPLRTQDAVTTCLFAWVLPDGRALAAQLGDGLIYGRVNNDTWQLSQTDKAFGNATTGLGIAKKLSDWRWLVFEEASDSIEISMMTDGISDDLLPESYSDFAAEVRKALRSKSTKNAKKWIAHQLNNWPAPLHGDDKTFAAIYLGNGHG